MPNQLCVSTADCKSEAFDRRTENLATLKSHRQWRTVAATLLLGATLVAGNDAARAESTALAPTGSLVPLTPCRLFDSRATPGRTPIAASAVLSVESAQRCGVPDEATALSVTVTVTEAGRGGYVTVWPTGEAMPLASNLNYRAAGTQANGVIIRRGTAGRLNILSTATTHIIVDVTAAFIAAPTGVATAGRFVGIPAVRALDTRNGGRPGVGGTAAVRLPTGVPSDAVAVAANITTTESSGEGFFSAYPAGSPRPASSALNTDAAGQTRAATQIVPVSSDGFSVFSQRGDHVIVDITGYFTGPSAPESGDGLFVALSPRRLVDTRGQRTPLPQVGSRRLTPGSELAAAAAVVINLTATESVRGGFVTAFPAATSLPVVSSLNSAESTTIANLAIVPLTEVGLDFYSSEQTHFIADITGYFTGPRRPVTIAQRPVVALPSNPKVLLVGDSTLAGVRWYANSAHALSGGDYTLEVESCRKLLGLSCFGREGRRPPNAVEAINAASSSYDVVVIMTGYNDWYTVMPDAFEQVVTAARAKGAKRIFWLTYREGTSYKQPGTGRLTNSSYASANLTLRQKVASGRYPDVRLADWSEYTAQSPSWFTADGVHFTIGGAYGAADYISRLVANDRGAPCPAPWTVGAAIESVCSHPDAHTAVPALTLYEGNPNEIHCYEVGDDRHVECKVDPKLG